MDQAVHFLLIFAGKVTSDDRAHVVKSTEPMSSFTKLLLCNAILCNRMYKVLQENAKPLKYVGLLVIKLKQNFFLL